MIFSDNIPVISVGVISNKHIGIEIDGDFIVRNQKDTFSGRWSADLLNDKIVVKQNARKIEADNEIIFEPQDTELESFVLKDVVIGAGFHWERKEKQRFSGSLKLLKNKDKIEAINIVPLEVYLVSVISSEMSAKASLQLLKAHAVVSRSWLLAQIQKAESLKNKDEQKTAFITENEITKWYDRGVHTLFDVCADDHCQRYQGITKISTNVSRQAVEETTGVVLKSGDKICDTRYSKACGGITESFENIWEPVKYNYLSSVIDYKFEPENYNLDFSDERNAVKWIKSRPHAFCNTDDKKNLSQILQLFDQQTIDFFRWKVEYSQKELAEIIRTKSGIDFGEIKELISLERGFSSRIIRLKIVGTKKTMIIGKELEIRRILSKKHLYSSAFVVEKMDEQNGIPQKFILWGAGWGHGAGMCQIGAAVMAAQGYQFDEILLKYFSNVKIQKVY